MIVYLRHRPCYSRLLKTYQSYPLRSFWKQPTSFLRQGISITKESFCLYPLYITQETLGYYQR